MKNLPSDIDVKIKGLQINKIEPIDEDVIQLEDLELVNDD